MSTHTTTTTLDQPDAVSLAVSDQGLLRGAIALAIISLLGFGLLYPLAGVGLGQALFPGAANGSLMMRDGQAVGSALVAQPFADARYFSPRPSAADYDPMALAASNLARTSLTLRRRIDTTRASVAQREGVALTEVPGDLVTQSGGGIDPHISPQAAAIQIARVAQARGMKPALVEATVAQYTEGKQWGVLGQARVNVLALNLALDAQAVPVMLQPTAP